jgi:hypothetical protein
VHEHTATRTIKIITIPVAVITDVLCPGDVETAYDVPAGPLTLTAEIKNLTLGCMVI